MEDQPMSSRIIDRGRGPEIEGTRVTVYRVMDFLREGSGADRIAEELFLSADQVEHALRYIDTRSSPATTQSLRAPVDPIPGGLRTRSRRPRKS